MGSAAHNDRRRQPLDGFELQGLGSDSGNSSDEKGREAGQQNGRFHGFPG
jgi:hypothetical protein